jgi:hypothetical protein
MSGPTVFAEALRRAIGRGVIGAAVVDRTGQLIDWVGATADDEQSSVANLVDLIEHDDTLASLSNGALGVLSLGREELSVVVAIAKRQMYVIAMVTDSADATIETVRALRDRVARLLPDRPRDPGASGAAPAELQVTEFGITVRRKNAN